MPIEPFAEWQLWQGRVVRDLERRQVVMLLPDRATMTAAGVHDDLDVMRVSGEARTIPGRHSPRDARASRQRPLTDLGRLRLTSTHGQV